MRQVIVRHGPQAVTLSLSGMGIFDRSSVVSLRGMAKTGPGPFRGAFGSIRRASHTGEG